MTMHRPRTRPPADPWSDWAIDAETSRPGLAEAEALVNPSAQTARAVLSPTDQQWAPEGAPALAIASAGGSVVSGIPPVPPTPKTGMGASTRPAAVDLVEDYTGEFDEIDAGEWNDEPFQYLDDPTATVIVPAKPAGQAAVAKDPLPKDPSKVPLPKDPSKVSLSKVPVSKSPSGPAVPPAKPGGQAVRPARRGRRVMRRTGLALLTVVAVATAYVTWQFATLRRNEANSQTLDLPGVPAQIGTIPGGPASTVPSVVTTYPNELNTDGTNFEDSQPADVVGSTVAPGPTTPVVTIPGQGSCDDDPACANAPVVVLPETEKPREGGLLVDRVDVEPIGGPDAQNILLIGSDSRADVPDSQKAGFGTVGGNRSDTIIVMRISPDGKNAALLSFPRDTYVHLAGTNKNDRINSAYAKGVNSLVRTLQENFNLPINHVAEVDFGGFQKIVGTLGGIEICFDYPARDKVTKLDVQAGCQLLNQTQSTAFVRSRHYEQFVNGVWKSDGRGDIGRVQRQQRFIKQVMDKVIGSGGRNPITAQALIGDLKSAVTLDKTYGITELYGTAKTFSAFEPNELQGFTLPTSPARIDGKAVLRVRRDQASQVVALFGTRR